jgi:RNA polymerase sigma factor (sigma-70 family)
LPDEGLTHAEVTALYERYGYFVRRRCALILRDTQLADDAMQEAFVRVMTRGAPLREMEQPLRWLHRVADRCCLDQIRRGKRLRTAVPLEAGTEPVGAHPAIAIELRDGVIDLLHALDEKDQEIAVMAFVDGMTQGQIAEEVGLSRITINKKVQAIRARAEKVLGERP